MGHKVGVREPAVVGWPMVLLWKQEYLDKIYVSYYKGMRGTIRVSNMGIALRNQSRRLSLWDPRLTLFAGAASVEADNSSRYYMIARAELLWDLDRVVVVVVVVVALAETAAEVQAVGAGMVDSMVGSMAQAPAA